MDQQTLIVVILGFVSFGALSIVLLAPTQEDKTKKRLSSLDATKNARRANAAGAEATQKDRRRKLNQALTKIDDQQKELKKKRRLTLNQRLEQTGLPITVKQYYMASAFVAIFFGIVGLISGQKLWITGALFMVGGLGAPRWFIGFCKKRRQKKFEEEFSNSIDVIVRGVKTGLPVNECLRIIATESPAPVREEFHILTEGLRIGLSMEQALERLYERMPLQEVNFFAIVLVIQQQTGGNLAEALTNLSGVLRQRKMMQGKIKALSAEAKASAMIIGSLPFLVMGAVQMASPDYLVPLFTTKMGNFILMGAGAWMGTGIFVMKKMMVIKV